MLSVTKIFTFACAHSLPNHNGLCCNIHGHNYKLEVTVGGPVNPTNGDSSQGMVIDFSELSSIIKQSVIEPYDHAFILPKDAISPFKSENTKIVYINGDRATAERMVVDIKDRIASAISNIEIYNRRIEVVKLKLWETDTSYAEWINSFLYFN